MLGISCPIQSQLHHPRYIHVSVGSRISRRPNVSFYTSSHPIGPQICNGSKGPEAAGKEIHVGEDCWIGRGAIFLTGMNIGTGSTVGTGSAVIKDVPPFHVVAGNPAPRESLARTMSKESLDEAL